MTKTIIVNCEKLPFGKTLGVASFVINLTKALSNHCRIVFAVPDLNEFWETNASRVINEFVDSVVEIKTLVGDESTAECIELLPHHFQNKLFLGKSIQIFHDFHVYDIPWKYAGSVEKLQSEFKSNALRADAIMCHFPRTYYELENKIGESVRSIFLTESPLLFDPTSDLPKGNETVTELLYPAQIQEHKNHTMLIKGLQKVVEEGHKVRILCPGSTFRQQLTDNLLGEIERLNLEASFKLLGKVSDEKLRELYARCDGLIIPSLAEGGAYVAMEGIKAGKFVAVNKIPSAYSHLKTIKAQVTWFDGQDPNDTARAIKQLAHKDAQSALKENAVARSRIEKMTWAAVSDKWLKVLGWLSGEHADLRMNINADGSIVEIHSF